MRQEQRLETNSVPHTHEREREAGRKPTLLHRPHKRDRLAAGLVLHHSILQTQNVGAGCSKNKKYPFIWT